MRYRILMLPAMLMLSILPVSAESNESCYEEICYVRITDEGFIPKALVVRQGSTVIWTNEDERRHTVTSGAPGEIEPPFKSLLLAKGESYEFYFNPAYVSTGRYQYFDQVSKTMRGEIIVEPQPKKDEEVNTLETIKIDFKDPESGIRNITLSNGIVESIEINPENKSLIIKVSTEDKFGYLEVTLDRVLIDSKESENKDKKFAVLVDGDEELFDEIGSTSKDRTLKIIIPPKTTRVDIIGTYVTPEFPLAVLIVMSIGFIIMIFKSRSIIQRYK